MKLTHRQIEVFRALMATSHVTRAAEALGSSQPTLSRELARLEQTLGMNLFDRVRGRLRPTVRAMALLDEVERSYIGLERIAAAAVGLRQFAQGRLAVACLPALSHALLPDATRRFMSQHPQAGLAITPQESPVLEQQLSEQRFDDERRSPRITERFFECRTEIKARQSLNAHIVGAALVFCQTLVDLRRAKSMFAPARRWRPVRSNKGFGIIV